MMRLFIATCLAIVSFSGCGSAAPPQVTRPSSVTLGFGTYYLGLGAVCNLGPINCPRWPGYGFDVPVAQSGNAANFQIASSNDGVLTGRLAMLGPGGQGSPNVELDPHEAGSAMLTVTGTSGATAQITVVVTTRSTMTITLNGLPTATQLHFAVLAPAAASCSSFEGGYSWYWTAPVAPARTLTLGNFPAMGNGSSSACVFSTVSVTALDASNVTLAQKTVVLPIAIGKDNPGNITIP